jgi:hypothetical protein
MFSKLVADNISNDELESISFCVDENVHPPQNGDVINQKKKTE